MDGEGKDPALLLLMVNKEEEEESIGCWAGKDESYSSGTGNGREGRP
jgi:hypothetical protein